MWRLWAGKREVELKWWRRGGGEHERGRGYLLDGRWV